MTASAEARRVPRDDGYGRSTRFYEVNGRMLPSVTAILGAVAKPALIGWAAKVERELVVRTAKVLWDELPTSPKMSAMAYEQTLQTRLGKEKAHRRAVEAAAKAGTDTHQLIEWNLRKSLGQECGKQPTLTDESTLAFSAYESWRQGINLAPLMIEQTVWSMKYGYAGTMDLGGMIDHEGQRLHVVADWKRTGRIYPEALLQNAAYVQAMIEMGHAEPPVAGCIVRLPKKASDPTFEAKIIPAEDQEKLFKVFLAVLEIWSWLDSQEERSK